MTPRATRTQSGTTTTHNRPCPNISQTSRPPRLTQSIKPCSKKDYHAPLQGLKSARLAASPSVDFMSYAPQAKPRPKSRPCCSPLALQARSKPPKPPSGEAFLPTKTHSAHTLQCSYSIVTGSFSQLKQPNSSLMALRRSAVRTRYAPYKALAFSCVSALFSTTYA